MAQLSKIALRVLNLPAFLLAVFIMYWSVPLCMLQNRIRPWKLRGARNDAYGWYAAAPTPYHIPVGTTHIMDE